MASQHRLARTSLCRLKKGVVSKMSFLIRYRFWVAFIVTCIASLITQIAVPSRLPAALPDDHESFLLVRLLDGRMVAAQIDDDQYRVIDGHIAVVASVWWSTELFHTWEKIRLPTFLSRLNPPVGTRVQTEITWSNYSEIHDDADPLVACLLASPAIDDLPSVVRSGLTSMSLSRMSSNTERILCKSCVIIGFVRACVAIISFFGILLGLAVLARDRVVTDMRSKASKCSSCGYILENTQAICPECGHHEFQN